MPIQGRLQLIELVSQKNNLYILTIKGGEFIGKKLRLLRDKNRLFLLKNIRNDSVFSKGSPDKKMVGVSPSDLFSSTLKVAPRPEVSLSSGPLPQTQRYFWPRVSEQLKIGSVSGEPLPNIKLNFYSKNLMPAITDEYSAVDVLSVLIGVSPRLLSGFIKAPQNHYRHFSLVKKTGGLRPISSPKIFIKTVQYWILDYLLFRLPQHEFCFSYKKGFSVKNNATIHLDAKYILCVDIENFFGNINRHQIKNLLVKNKFNNDIADAISGIVTLDDSLPQGAPTSPILSNAYLYEFDDEIRNLCSKNDAKYSRYADDLTFSSDSPEKLQDILSQIPEYLLRFNLKLNTKKTRLISRNNCQVITGIAINNGTLRPCRKFRKKIRAAFYQAYQNNNIDALPKLRGYINYLKSFDNGDTDYNFSMYQSIIEKLTLISK